MRPDQSITFLKQFGYSVLRMPRPDVIPLEILSRNGKDLNRLGKIDDVMRAGTIPLPAVSPDNPSGTLTGKQSSKMDLTIGLSILGTIVRAMGGANLGLSAGYKNAKSVVFEFAEVIENNVAVAQLEQYLNGASIKPENSPGMIERLIEDEIYVVTSTIKSKKFVVDAQAESGAKANVDVPVIASAVGGTVAVAAEGSVAGKVSYSGPSPLVFGIQAARLFFDDNGQFTLADPMKAGEAAMRGGEVTKAVTFLDVPGAFARIDEGASEAARSGR